MSLIDSNNFITHLVWSGLIDKATCGQLKEAIELCKVDAIPMSVIEDIRAEVENYEDFSAYDRQVARVIWGFFDKHISGKE